MVFRGSGGAFLMVFRGSGGFWRSILEGHFYWCLGALEMSEGLGKISQIILDLIRLGRFPKSKIHGIVIA